MQPEFLENILSSGLLVIVLGIAALVASYLLAIRRGIGGRNWIRIALNVAGWVFIVFGLVALFIFPFTVVVLLVPLVGIVVLIEILVKRSVNQQYALLWLLTTSAERLMPMVPVIEAFARERGGLFAYRARFLAALLRCGVALPTALKQVPGMVPVGALPLIHVGHQSGALAPALRQAASAHERNGQGGVNLTAKMVYLCLLILFGIHIVSGIMIWIIPSFVSIFEDFGVDLPVLTVVLIQISNVAVQFFPLTLLLLALAVALLFYTLSRYVGLVAWDLPGTRRLMRRFDTAVILDALALVAARQRPMHEALDCLARSYPKSGVRWRLARVVDEVGQGRDCWQSLQTHDLLGRADVVVLQSAQRVGNLAWALSEAADSNRRRASYRLHAIAQLAFPPLILAIGGIVMFIVVALFLPLITLIHSLS